MRCGKETITLAIRGAVKEDRQRQKRTLLTSRKQRKQQRLEQLEHYRGSEATPSSSMLELLAYKGITKDSDHFIILREKADGYADMLSIRGQGVRTMSIREQDQIIDGFHHFLQTAIDDMKIIISPFPVDASKQKSYWQSRYIKVMNDLKRETDIRRKRQLQTQLHYIENKQWENDQVEKKLVSEEFILLIFGKRPVELRNLRDAVISWGGDALVMEPLSLERKKETLFRINNLNTKIK